MSFDLGDAIPLIYTLNNTATVAITVTSPDGAETHPAINQAGSPPTVTYTVAVLADQVGLWRYLFTATGTVTDSEAGQFYVSPALGENVYTTLPELKTALNLPPSDTADDDDLQDAILVASRQVDADCQRHFYQAAETRTLPPGADLWNLRLPAFMDLVSVTTLKTDTSGDGTFETTWAASDYQLLCADYSPNVNAGPEPRPYRRIKAVGAKTFPSRGYGARDDRVEVAGVWGWPAVPDMIRRATRVMAAEVFRLRDAPFGAVGFGEIGIVRVRENPKYMRLIADYRLLEAAVPVL
jgi:hypothetical protein